MENKKKDNIPDLFGSMMQGDSERLQIAKELFTAENIDMKTEMTASEVNSFARAEFIKEIFAQDSLSLFIDKFERLRVSMGRKGRAEFVECVKERKQDEGGLGNLANLFKAGKI